MPKRILKLYRFISFSRFCISVSYCKTLFPSDFHILATNQDNVSPQTFVFDYAVDSDVGKSSPYVLHNVNWREMQLFFFGDA